MRKFIIKRVLISVVILFFVGLIIYTIMRMLPTSYVESIARARSMQPNSKSFEEWMAQLSVTYGMDKGIILGYFQWLGNAVQGKFGDSWFYTIPVTEKFHETVWLSFIMGLISMILEIIIAIPLGVLAATKQYSKTDYTVSIISFMTISLPTFFFASLLKLVFSIKLGWFELYGLVGRYHMQMNSFEQFWDKAYHLVLPIICLTVLSIGGLMRYTRTNMLEVLSADYIRTARSKGLSEKNVIFNHAFRNTLIPLVTIIGGSLPGLFSGALITEQLFAIPGIGYTAYNAMIAGDIPFSMFYMVFLAVLTLAGNLISDILYAVVDPRVRIA